jgi:hypothetical protein
MADSFEDEAIDDAANRPLLCDVGTDQPVRGLGACTINKRALSALHTAGLPILSCCPEVSLSEYGRAHPHRFDLLGAAI